jgi:predicted transcriptional regulator of viral defense system
MNGAQNVTKGSLGKTETKFLAQVSARATFTVGDVKNLLQYERADSAWKFLERLQEKGWIRRVRRGRFAVIPLSSGEDRTPQLHEFIVAMELVTPAAIAYWSALNHHGMTEQLPRTVFVATDHPVRRPPKQVLGVSYKIVSLRPAKFFGVVKDWIDEQPFQVTDKEKTIVDGLDLPQYVGGVDEIAKALAGNWPALNETKLRNYVAKIGNGAVAKRLGFLMETFKLGDPEALRKAVPIASGFSRLDPTLGKRGKYNRRWGLLINAEVRG